MISTEVARKLNLPINDPEVRDAIKAYALLRMEQIKESLVSVVDPRELALLQGQHREAKRLLTLREEVEQAKKSKNPSA